MTTPRDAHPAPDESHVPPELRIPDELRKPVERPASLTAKDRESNVVRQVTSAARGWAIAFDFIFTILAGVVLGYLLDRWQGWSPWGTLGGLAVGFVGAFYRIVRMTKQGDIAARAEKRRD